MSHTICQMRPDPLTIFDLHECRVPGKWVGVTDSVLADAVNGLWMEDYHTSFIALDTGEMQVVVKESQCQHDRCREKHSERLREIYGEGDDDE